MKKQLFKLIGYSHTIEANFIGKGFTQGIGFNIHTKVLRIFGLKFITDIKIEGDTEWLRNLKVSWEKDKQQQKLENERIEGNPQGH